MLGVLFLTACVAIAGNGGISLTDRAGGRPLSMMERTWNHQYPGFIIEYMWWLSTSLWLKLVEINWFGCDLTNHQSTCTKLKFPCQYFRILQDFFIWLIELVFVDHWCHCLSYTSYSVVYICIGVALCLCCTTWKCGNFCVKKFVKKLSS